MLKLINNKELVEKYRIEYKDYDLNKLDKMLFNIEMKDNWSKEDYALYEAITQLMKEKEAKNND